MASEEKWAITTSGNNYICDEEDKKELEQNYNENKNDYKCEDEYIVRGAKLRCTCGSHRRKLHLPKDHGNQILKNPMLHENDCRVGDTFNINSFGVCSSKTPPEGAETVLLKAVYEAGDKEEGIDVTKENVKGKLCTPMIVGTWMDTKEDTMIYDNEASNKYPAVSTHSFLVCICGGFIEPQTSGQEYDSSKDIIKK